MVEARASIRIEIEAASDETQRPDLRSASEHLANIRKVFRPAIADLAAAFGVSRQAIYKWMGGESNPQEGHLVRIQALSHVADACHESGVGRAPAMLKMKVFDGRSLLDLAAAGEITSSRIDLLISEAQAMDSAYDRSGLARSKARPSDDWRAGVSIPGFGCT
jgi:transcriptional regulator with XRE-family HTH domain